MIREFARRGLFGLRRRWSGGERGLVLLYHRIAEEPSNPYGLAVSPGHFEEHLQVLHELGFPMSLGTMARAVREGALPDRAIAVTFDDAYIDVWEAGTPLLATYDVPATVFVTVGAGGRSREFWWDELERVLLRPESLPEVLRLEIGDTSRSWELGADAGPLDLPRAAGWHILTDEVPTKRHAAFREIHRLLLPLADHVRTEVMDGMLGWAGDSADAVRPSRRVMSPDEVTRATADGLLEAGAHTVTHSDLPSVSPARRRLEAEGSKVILEEWVGTAVHGFAYPYGRYDDDSVAAVEEAGYRFACTGDHASVRPGTALLRLPRVDAPTGGGEALARVVRRFLG